MYITKQQFEQAIEESTYDLSFGSEFNPSLSKKFSKSKDGFSIGGLPPFFSGFLAIF